MATVENKTISIGDILSFKSDVEQYGEVIIIRGRMITVKSTSDTGFGGDYIGGDDTFSSDQEDFWL